MLFRRALTKGVRVTLAEGDSANLQYLRAGKFKHPVYGDFEITSKILAEMKKNFDEKIRGIDIALDYFHESGKEASGWIRALELRNQDTELWAFIEWTPKAKQKITEKELLYFSPDFAFQWKDPETGVQFSNVIFGGGLTNRPFVKEMEQIAAAEIAAHKEGKLMNEAEMKAKIAELEAANKKLSEGAASTQAKLDAMGADPAAEVDALKKQVEELKAALAAAQAETAKMKEGAVLAEKTAEFNVMLTEGKACVAQKEAFMKGDLAEFVKLAQPINTKGAGTTEGSGAGTGDREDRVLKCAEEKRKADPKLSVPDSITLASKEIK